MFGMRVHPVKGRRLFHQGVDLAAPCGTPVYSAGNGRVTEARYSRSYGWFVHIRHAEGYSTLYAHMSGLHVKAGTLVRIGQHIGDVGHTGVATGNHLHFELRKVGVLLDPLSWPPFK